MDILGKSEYLTKHDTILLPKCIYGDVYGLTDHELETTEADLNYWRERLLEKENDIVFFFTIQLNFQDLKALNYNTLDHVHADLRKWLRSFMHYFHRMPQYFYRVILPASGKLHLHGFLLNGIRNHTGNFIAQRGEDFKGKDAFCSTPAIHRHFKANLKQKLLWKNASLDIVDYHPQQNAIDYVLRKQNKDMETNLVDRYFDTSAFCKMSNLFIYNTDAFPKNTKQTEELLRQNYNPPF